MIRRLLLVAVVLPLLLTGLSLPAARAAGGTLTLTCCCKPPVITIEVPFTAGGLGAGNRGSIEVRLTAVKTSN